MTITPKQVIINILLIKKNIWYYNTWSLWPYSDHWGEGRRYCLTDTGAFDSMWRWYYVSHYGCYIIEGCGSIWWATSEYIDNIYINENIASASTQSAPCVTDIQFTFQSMCGWQVNRLALIHHHLHATLENVESSFLTKYIHHKPEWPLCLLDFVVSTK